MKNKLIVAALLFVPMSAYAHDLPAQMWPVHDLPVHGGHLFKVCQHKGDDNGHASTGESGPKGATGARGPRGFTGAQGKPGMNGKNGAPGAQGQAGVVNYAKVNSAISASSSSTLIQAKQFSTAGDKTALASANTDAQVMANAAQSNSEAYTNQSYQQANTNAQGYAQQAQSKAESFAQGAASQAQINAEQYAASGIAAALAMPSSPYLTPGHYAIGIQAATYGGEQGFGARATYQMSAHWSANAGLSGGSGEYGQVGATVGVQFEG